MLLKKGGSVVYFGELGEHSHKLVTYFEERGARSIERGENPANWVLTAMTSGSQDYAEEYIQSKLYKEVKESLAALKANPSAETNISYDTVHACPKKMRYTLTSHRLMKIYWRSPSYNCEFHLCGCVGTFCFVLWLTHFHCVQFLIMLSIENDRGSRDCGHPGLGSFIR